MEITGLIFFFSWKRNSAFGFHQTKSIQNRKENLRWMEDQIHNATLKISSENMLWEGVLKSGYWFDLNRFWFKILLGFLQFWVPPRPAQSKPMVTLSLIIAHLHCWFSEWYYGSSPLESCNLVSVPLTLESEPTQIKPVATLVYLSLAYLVDYWFLEWCCGSGPPGLARLELTWIFFMLPFPCLTL